MRECVYGTRMNCEHLSQINGARRMTRSIQVRRTTRTLGNTVCPAYQLVPDQFISGLDKTNHWETVHAASTYLFICMQLELKLGTPALSIS